MKRSLIGIALLLAAAWSVSTAEGAMPQVGAPAPAFEMQGSDGKVHRLEDYQGQQAVVIAWFPKAFTGG